MMEMSFRLKVDKTLSSDVTTVEPLQEQSTS